MLPSNLTRAILLFDDRLARGLSEFANALRAADLDPPGGKPSPAS